jgi:uncharacterized protein (TIGR02246 family)
MRTFLAALLLLLLVQLCSGRVGAQTKDTHATIFSQVTSYVDAYNRGDVEAVVDHWANDAEYLLASGERVTGRDALRKVFTAALAKENRGTISVSGVHIRVLSDTTASEEGTVTVVRDGETIDESSYLAIYVKQDDEWKLTTVRETAVEPKPAASAADKLEALSWLVGEWRDESEEATVSSTVRWSGNNAFLVYQFKADIAGQETFEGTQVIGWDPNDQVIRSWMFDSDGGFGEGVWTKDNERWVVKFEQTLPEGGRATATNVYLPKGENSYAWHSYQRTLNGEVMPSLNDITIVRVLPELQAVPTTEALPVSGESN